ncbi:RNA polymerase sigma factor [Paenibacillus albiflavus]|uniref:RNA polymerase sigma factor n=1 Tax=Paenibacillus albiflavus TaxID=2545760 RepID=A0A4R4E1N9_9BACL|nr:RNA polymerase sigma factor [Paenibacillus albiflavus]TCZ73404.1 RNA polymerase sigma factor [Paenibacillus albiflavus]
MEQLTDEQIIEQVRQGQMEVYRMLVDRHQGYIYTIIRQMVDHTETAEDLTQEVFVKMYRSIEGYRGDAKLTTWLYRLTVNVVQDYRRSLKRRPLQSAMAKVKDWLSYNEAQPEEQIISREERDLKWQLIAELPDKYRLILILHYLKEFSYQEIAEITQMPIKTIETRLYRAKKMLQERWMEVERIDYQKYNTQEKIT